MRHNLVILQDPKGRDRAATLIAIEQRFKGLGVERPLFSFSANLGMYGGFVTDDDETFIAWLNQKPRDLPS